MLIQPLIGDRREDELEVLPRVKIESSDKEEAGVIPLLPGIAHVVLVAEDDGEPSLTAYRR